jgi:membrane peptidoglycan carboxypeptidase
MTNILASNTDPKQNPIWGDFAIQSADGTRRPATLKTGTTQDANDLVAFGYLPPPDDAGRAAGEYALDVGVWYGNSDGSPVLTPQNPVLSTDVAAPTWQGFTQEVSNNWTVNDFPRPDGIVEADVDAWSGGVPTQFTTQTYHEVFISGTQPTAADTTKVGMQVVPDANGDPQLWVDGCATPTEQGFLNLDNVEADHADWHAANADWIARAKQGPGTAGGPDPTTPTKTSFIFDQRNTPFGKSWGAPFPPTTTCTQAPPSPSPTIFVLPSPTILVTPPPITPPPITPPPPPTQPPPPTEPPTPKPTKPPPTEPPPTEPPPSGAAPQAS